MIDAYEKAKELRTSYRSCLKIADETDSKKEDTWLRVEAKATLEELKKICPHKDVIIMCSEYDGSYTNDYEDSMPECRKCLCCDIKEAHHLKFKNSKFEYLKDVDVQWRIDSKHHDQLTNPLNYLLSECQEVAAACLKPMIRFINDSQKI